MSADMQPALAPIDAALEEAERALGLATPVTAVSAG
jgi:hypothetical protein